MKVAFFNIKDTKYRVVDIMRYIGKVLVIKAINLTTRKTVTAIVNRNAIWVEGVA